LHKEHGQDQLAGYIHELAYWLLEKCPSEIEEKEQIKPIVYLPKEFVMGRDEFKAWVEEGLVLDTQGLDSADVDLIFTMGGDGTVLNAAWMFQRTVPPIMTFHFGTVGFLSLFNFANFRDRISTIVHGGTRVNIRMRLHCILVKKGQDENMVASFECNVMNEVVVDRGPSPFMATIDLHGDGELLTSVQADGLIVATTTGSTAYSMSAGGSVVHPDVPAIMVTPICPHTLSLRPFILPDSMELTLRVSEASRSSAWVSFDGRHREELGVGDELRVSCSKYPVTTVARQTQTRDWFDGLSQCLRWNERPVKAV